MRVTNDEILAQIQEGIRQFESLPEPVRLIRQAQVDLMRRSYRIERLSNGAAHGEANLAIR